MWPSVPVSSRWSQFTYMVLLRTRAETTALAVEGRISHLPRSSLNKRGQKSILILGMLVYLNRSAASATMRFGCDPPAEKGR